MSNRTLADQLDDPVPVAWVPDKPGEKIIGKFLRVETRESDHGPYPVVIFTDDEADLRSWHAFHAAAQAQLAQARPEPGEQIGIKYGGKVTSERTGREYVDWRVVVDRPEPTDWDAVAADVEGADEVAPPSAEEPF